MCDKQFEPLTIELNCFVLLNSPIVKDGWCQDLIQAAMLNFTNEAANQLANRAAATDHGGFRFEGFVSTETTPSVGFTSGRNLTDCA